jgi:hypothetical protein
MIARNTVLAPPTNLDPGIARLVEALARVAARRDDRLERGEGADSCAAASESEQASRAVASYG